MIARIQVTTSGSGRRHLEGSLMLGRQVGDIIFIVYILLGISPASNCSWPTFRNLVSVPSSKAGCRQSTSSL